MSKILGREDPGHRHWREKIENMGKKCRSKCRSCRRRFSKANRVSGKRRSGKRSKRRSGKRSKRRRSGKRSKTVQGTKVVYWPSTRTNKKWMTITPSGKKVHWGDSNMKDYTQHRSLKRRKSYRSRHRGIRLKDGSRAIDKRWSPAWLSYYVTW